MRKRTTRKNNKKYNRTARRRKNKKYKKTNRKSRRRRMRGGAMDDSAMDGPALPAGFGHGAIRRGRANSRPIFLVTNGPTGAGKSQIPAKTCKHLGMEFDRDKWGFAVVDDIIENSDAYKEKVNEIIRKACRGDLALCEPLRAKLEDPDKEIIDKFFAAYGAGRYPLGQHWLLSGDEEKTARAAEADTINDQLVADAAREQKHIVLEMTGSEWPTWLYEPDEHGVTPASNFGIDDYDIIFAWSLADMCQVMGRNKSRAVEDMEEYLADQVNTGAPRLPDIRDNGVYNGNQDNIMEVLETLIRRCHGNPLCPINTDEICARGCGQKSRGEELAVDRGNVDRIIIFNNTNRWDDSDDPEIVYDSHDRAFAGVTAEGIITLVNDLVAVDACKRTQRQRSPLARDRDHALSLRPDLSERALRQGFVPFVMNFV